MCNTFAILKNELSHQDVSSMCCMYRGLGLPALVRVVDPEQVALTTEISVLVSMSCCPSSSTIISVDMKTLKRQGKLLTEEQVGLFCLTWRLWNRSAKYDFCSRLCLNKSAKVSWWRTMITINNNGTSCDGDNDVSIWMDYIDNTTNCKIKSPGEATTRSSKAETVQGRTNIICRLLQLSPF